jgi:hypothetical protein
MGAWVCAIAGGLYIGGIWEPILAKVAIGLWMGGLGTIGYGIWSRITYIFYQLHTKRTGKAGKPNLNRSKLKKSKVG